MPYRWVPRKIVDELLIRILKGIAHTEITRAMIGTPVRKVSRKKAKNKIVNIKAATAI